MFRRAIIMDVASTVCDVGTKVPLLAMKKAWEDFGVNIPYKLINNGMGSSKIDHIYITKNLIYKYYPQYISKVINLNENEILGNIEYHTLKILKKEIHHSILFDDLAKLFKILRKKHYKLGHTTGYTRTMMIPILDIWEKYCDYIPDSVICSDEVDRGRPYDDSIIKCSQNMYINLNDCINIDDSEVGIKAGINAGIKSIGVYEYGNYLGWLILDKKYDYEEERQKYIKKLISLTPYVFPTTSYLLNKIIIKDK